ncbi:5-hydroxytryptamine receptor [Trichinella zimbabwensis]|uniref:5-hydroxytryptamine receptor n=1 Tax=Trichinella zimbabwensis TaxID=268475 RepID=A0A0V1HW34_9BILA|nr:5-hydroxytryptamine receptor [Trichinella zimbabwensis]
MSLERNDTDVVVDSRPVTTGLVALILAVIVATTVVGNALVIVAIITERSLQRVQYYLILSLAVADELVGTVVSPLAFYYDLTNRWTLGLLMCDFWIFFDVLCCSASILNLVVIALDRYWSVSDVAYVQRRNRSRILAMIALVWLTALLISIPPVFGWKDSRFADRVLHQHVCLISQDLTYQIFSTVAAFYGPLFLLMLLYWRIYVVAKKRIQREKKRKSTPGFITSSVATTETESCLLDRSVVAALKAEENSTPLPAPPERSYSTVTVLQNCKAAKKPKQTRRKTIQTIFLKTTTEIKQKTSPKREARAARTLAVVTGTFVLCWLPFFVLALYRPIACPSSDHSISRCSISPLLESVFLWLGYVNSALNPIIYTVFSPDFAKAFKRILSKVFFVRNFMPNPRRN